MREGKGFQRTRQEFKKYKNTQATKLSSWVLLFFDESSCHMKIIFLFFQSSYVDKSKKPPQEMKWCFRQDSRATS